MARLREEVTTLPAEKVWPPFSGYVRSAQSGRTRLSRVSGAVDDMVIQRGDGGGSIVLTAAGESPMRARAYDRTGVVVAEADAAGAPHDWRARLNLPVGGPYRLEALDDRGMETIADGVLVGDLWVLAGQSNMYGMALLEGSEEPHPLVHMLDMARRWRPAEEPLHSLAHSPDRVHWSKLEDKLEGARTFVHWLGAGSSLAFAKEMVSSTSVPVGLIAVAHGGSSLEKWSPDLAHKGRDSLYGSMRLSVDAAGGRIRGVLWYQGENETGSKKLGELFPGRLRSLISAIRRDFGAATEFYHVQLGRTTTHRTRQQERLWSLLRTYQNDPTLGATGMVTAVDLDLDDPIHIGTYGLRRLGRRLARMATGRAQCIELASVEREGRLSDWPEKWFMLKVRLRFSGLSGGLTPRVRVPGFSVRSPDGTLVPLLFRAEVLEDDRCSVVLTLAGLPRSKDDGIWYGYGDDPVCDLIDEDDNAVPAFGPIPLRDRPKAQRR